MAKWLVGSLAAASLLFAAGVYPALAQSGYCLFGCAKDASLILRYKVEDRTHDYTSDRYFLWIGQQRVAVQGIQIIVDNNFNGAFNTKAVEVVARTSGKAMSVESVTWDPDQRALNIALVKPVPAQEEIEIVLSQVLNPSTEGIYKLNARILGTGPNPIYQYVGTWAISID